jgi:ABC-type branched-subunit amino acid transport system ATPase component
LDISDRITVMHQGAVIADGSPDVIQHDASVRASYLGAG